MGNLNERKSKPYYHLSEKEVLQYNIDSLKPQEIIEFTNMYSKILSIRAEDSKTVFDSLRKVVKDV